MWRLQTETPGQGPGLATEVVYAPPKLNVEDGGWQLTEPAPWRRYFGRYLDAMFFGFLFFAVLGAVMAIALPSLFDRFWGEGGLGNSIIFSAMATVFVNVFFSGTLIGLTGTSLGKWVFGTRITRPSGKPIGVKAAILRELNVYVRGLALGIPVAAIIAALVGYSTLTKNGKCSWDEGRDWMVTHRKPGALQITMSVIGIAAVLALYGISTYLAAV